MDPKELKEIVETYIDEMQNEEKGQDKKEKETMLSENDRMSDEAKVKQEEEKIELPNLETEYFKKLDEAEKIYKEEMNNEKRCQEQDKEKVAQEAETIHDKEKISYEATVRQEEEADEQQYLEAKYSEIMEAEEQQIRLMNEIERSYFSQDDDQGVIIESESIPASNAGDNVEHEPADVQGNINEPEENAENDDILNELELD